MKVVRNEKSFSGSAMLGLLITVVRFSGKFFEISQMSFVKGNFPPNCCPTLW